MHESLWLLPGLFLTGLLAGLVDSISGGGGLLTLPVLLNLGISPQLALGTNKFQSSFGSFTASLYYRKHRVVSIRKSALGIAFTIIGTAIGTIAVQHIDPDLLRHIIPVLLFCIAVYTIFSPSIGERQERGRMPPLVFYPLFGILFGFYDGFFGPGVGSFWAITFVLGLGMDLVRATGATKVMNFTSNIVSAILFIVGGYVWYAAGAAMAVGQIAGSTIGARLVIRRGAKLIRPLFITIVLLTTLKLIYSNYF